jgi:hypothetical protein
MSESGAINPLPPPWGAPLDPHFTPIKAGEAFGQHTQVTAEKAAELGWLFRSEWYKRLVPDTRRCLYHGEIMFPEAELTQAQLDIVYFHQNRGMATGPIG